MRLGHALDTTGRVGAGSPFGIVLRSALWGHSLGSRPGTPRKWEVWVRTPAASGSSSIGRAPTVSLHPDGAGQVGGLQLQRPVELSRVALDPSIEIRLAPSLRVVPSKV